jgi:hypothetical protein
MFEREEEDTHFFEEKDTQFFFVLRDPSPYIPE